MLKHFFCPPTVVGEFGTLRNISYIPGKVGRLSLERPPFLDSGQVAQQKPFELCQFTKKFEKNQFKNMLIEMITDQIFLIIEEVMN